MLHFGAVSMVFLPDFPGSYAIQYNRAANFTARTTKNFPKLQKKFLGVPAKISRCSTKSFGLCHEIIPPVVLKSFGLSQDLPLSQNGQNFRRKKLIKQWADRDHYATWKSPIRPSRPIGLIGPNCTISTSYQFSDHLKFTENALFSPCESVVFSPFRHVLPKILKSQRAKTRLFLALPANSKTSEHL